MLNAKELMLQDTANRNKVFYIALWITYLLTVMSIMEGTVATSSWFIFGLETVMMAATTYSIWTRRFTKAFVYIGLTGVGIPVILSVFGSASLSNFLSIYLILVYAVLYMNWIPMILTIAADLVLEIYMAFIQEGGGFDSATRSSTLFVFVMVAVTAVGSVFVSRRLQKQLDKMRMEAAELMREQTEQANRLVAQVGTVSARLTDIAEASSTSQTSFREMTHAFQEIASGANSQAESTSDITRSVQETSEQIAAINESLSELKEQTERTHSMSEEGGERMESLSRSISDFSASIQRMTQEMSSLDAMIRKTSAMSEMIQDISQQTNLLALNASIEAARAGESGRGFAVVAGEIRKLSDSVGRSATSISEQLDLMQRQAEATQTTMSSIAEQMDRSSRVTNETKQAFGEVRTAIGFINEEMAEYRRRMGAIAVASHSIEEATENFASISEEASATLEELAATIQTLAEQNETTVGKLRQTDEEVKNMVVK